MSLVAWYKLDGSADDASGAALHGTANGAVSYSVGKLAQAAVFGGSTSYLTLPSCVVANCFSVALWVNPTASGAILSHSASQLLSYDATEQKVTLTVGNVGATSSFSDSTAALSVPLSTWSHLVLILWGNTAAVYVNGALALEVTTSFSFASWTGNWYVASLSGLSQFFAGKVDDIKVYNDRLSPKEVQEASRGKLLHYTCNSNQEYPGGIVQDMSGYDHHAVLTSTSPSWDASTKIGSGSYVFTGVEDLTTDQLFLDSSSQSWTVAGWVRLDSDAAGQQLNNFNLGNKLIHSSGKALLYANSGDNDHYVYSSVLPLNEWLHIAFVYDTATLTCQIYLNGILNASSGNFSATDTAAGFSSSTVFGDGFIGALSDVRVYATPLSAAAILQLAKTRAVVDSRGNLFLAGDCYEATVAPVEYDDEGTDVEYADDTILEAIF
jgi:hypothetical protein